MKWGLLLVEKNQTKAGKEIREGRACDCFWKSFLGECLMHILLACEWKKRTEASQRRELLGAGNGSIGEKFESKPGGQPLPRRELQLQGPRPSPLKVRKDSYMIKKAPPAPPPPLPPSEPTSVPPPRRSPVIIYTVSPKVIHTKPSEFMSLVQRLTGISSSYSSAAAAEEDNFASEKSGVIPPTACFSGAEGVFSRESNLPGDYGVVSPRTLPLLPPSTTTGSSSPFSQSEDMSPLNFMNELSPGLQGNKAFMESNFLNSPGNLLSTPTLASPSTYWDLFNQFKE